MDERSRLVEWLEIENFRGIRQAQLPFSALTVLVGLNGSGKTTILEALYLASAYPVGTSVRRIQNEEHDPAGRSPILYVLQRHAYKGAKQRAPDAEISRRSDPAGSWKADEGRENQRSQPEGSSGEAGDSPQDREEDYILQIGMREAIVRRLLESRNFHRVRQPERIPPEKFIPKLMEILDLLRKQKIEVCSAKRVMDFYVALLGFRGGFGRLGAEMIQGLDPQEIEGAFGGLPLLLRSLLDEQQTA